MDKKNTFFRLACAVISGVLLLTAPGTKAWSQAAMAKLPSGRRLPWISANPGVVNSLQTFLQSPGGRNLLVANPALSGLLKLDAASPLQLALVGGMTSHLPQTLTAEAVLAAHKEASLGLEMLLKNEAHKIVQTVSAGTLASPQELGSIAKDLAPFGAAWPAVARSIGEVSMLANAAKSDQTMTKAKLLAQNLLSDLLAAENGGLAVKGSLSAKGSSFPQEAKKRSAVRQTTEALASAHGAKAQLLALQLEVLARASEFDNVRVLVIRSLADDAIKRLGKPADRDLLLQELQAVANITQTSSRRVQAAGLGAFDALLAGTLGKDRNLSVILAAHRLLSTTSSSKPQVERAARDTNKDWAPSYLQESFAELGQQKGVGAEIHMRFLAESALSLSPATRLRVALKFLDDAGERLYRRDRDNVVLAIESAVTLAVRTPQAAVKDEVLKKLRELRDLVRRRTNLFGGYDKALVEELLRSELAVERSFRPA